MRLCYDAIVPGHIPPNAQIVAGYTSGNWPTFPTLAASFPHAVLVSIAINASHDAMVLDVETGDASPSDAPGWCLRQTARGQIPTVYCNTSTWPAVKAAFAVARAPVPHWWRADYNGRAALEMGEIAHQYTNGQVPTTAPNRVPGCDTSAVADYWPGVDAAPAPQQEDAVPYLAQGPTVGIWIVDGGKATHVPDMPDVAAYQAAGVKLIPLTDALITALGA